MSRREKRVTSSSVREEGSVFSIPSLYMKTRVYYTDRCFESLSQVFYCTFSLLIWMGENFLSPPLSGTRRLNRALKKQISLLAYLLNHPIAVWPNTQSPHLVRLRGLVEHAGVDGRSHQIVSSCDGVNVPSEMKVELQINKDIESAASFS